MKGSIFFGRGVHNLRKINCNRFVVQNILLLVLIWTNSKFSDRKLLLCHNVKFSSKKPKNEIEKD